MAQTIVNAREADILEAFAKRLRHGVSEFGPETCFFSDTRTPITIPPSDVFCVISPGGDGNFPDPFFASGGHLQLTEESEIEVTVYLKSNLDQAERLQTAVLGHERGLIGKYKPAVLRWLLLNDARTGPWEPSDGTGDLLRDQLAPRRSRQPEIVETEDGNAWVRFGLVFSVTWDWSI